MNTKVFSRRTGLVTTQKNIGYKILGGLPWLLLFGIVWVIMGSSAIAATKVLYETRFEKTEGFDEALTLIGQGGWVGYGSGGNGLVSDFFTGEGQHAFIGFVAPTNNGDFLNAWRPVNYVPGSTNSPLVRFSVLMSVEDSSARANRDDFRWSVYNGRGDRLFSLDFDNDSLGINYLLDDGKFVATGRSFTNSQPYLLEVRMDFSTNRWSASLGGVGLTTNLPITTASAELDFGDVDAVWAIRTPGSPGDNFMVFDNYRVEAEVGEAIRPRVEPLGLLPNKDFVVRCRGSTGVVYILQGSEDLKTWVPLKTNSVPVDGYFDHADKSGPSKRFYRMQQR